jgi:hypothetical protein
MIVRPQRRMTRMKKLQARSPRRGRAPRKLVCLETYWSDHGARAFSSASVQPFFEGLATQLDPALRIAHRFVESPTQLVAYTRRGKGLLWSDPEVFDSPVYYLSFHGSPGTVRTALARLGPARLCKAFEGWGSAYDNLVYVAACSVLAGASGGEAVRAAVSGAVGMQGHPRLYD